MRNLKIVIVAKIALIAASTGIMAQQPAAPPTFLNSFKKVLADQNLKALAGQTNDADVLLGLAYLAPANCLP